jgi:phage shock protein A
MNESNEVPEKGKWSLSRVGELLKNVLQLETNVAVLQEENQKLRQEVGRLQRMVDEHNGQLKVLVGALNTTLESRVQTAAQQAAIDTMTRLLGDQSSSPSEDD